MNVRQFEYAVLFEVCKSVAGLTLVPAASRALAFKFNAHTCLAKTRASKDEGPQ